MSLSFLLIFNNNKLRSTSHELKKTNNLIFEQKERLFAEVHHRVKNNLAVMAALMELENMESNDPSVNRVLTQTQRRIKSMPAVQEVIYKSDEMSKVWIHGFLPGIQIPKNWCTRNLPLPGGGLRAVRFINPGLRPIRIPKPNTNILTDLPGATNI